MTRLLFSVHLFLETDHANGERMDRLLKTVHGFGKEMMRLSKMVHGSGK
jgi:hypothetical protein